MLQQSYLCSIVNTFAKTTHLFANLVTIEVLLTSIKSVLIAAEYTNTAWYVGIVPNFEVFICTKCY